MAGRFKAAGQRYQAISTVTARLTWRPQTVRGRRRSWPTVTQPEPCDLSATPAPSRPARARAPPRRTGCPSLLYCRRPCAHHDWSSGSCDCCLECRCHSNRGQRQTGPDEPPLAKQSGRAWLRPLSGALAGCSSLPLFPPYAIQARFVERRQSRVSGKRPGGVVFVTPRAQVIRPESHQNRAPPELGDRLSSRSPLFPIPPKLIAT